MRGIRALSFRVCLPLQLRLHHSCICCTLLHRRSQLCQPRLRVHLRLESACTALHRAAGLLRDARVFDGQKLLLLRDALVRRSLALVQLRAARRLFGQLRLQCRHARVAGIAPFLQPRATRMRRHNRLLQPRRRRALLAALLLGVLRPQLRVQELRLQQHSVIRAGN